MRQDKQFIFALRKQGKSYSEIQKEIKISKSTLSVWFRDVDWSKHTKAKNSQKIYALSKERISKLNKARQQKLDLYYQKAEKEAEQEFEVFKNEPLFMAGLMLYAGEGDKVNKNIIRISNSEFYINKYFVKFSIKYLNFKRENIKCGLILYPDNNINECKKRWSFELGINESNFHKTQIIQGREKIKKLQYGVGMVIISNTFLKKKLMKWIEMCKVEIDAGII